MMYSRDLIPLDIALIITSVITITLAWFCADENIVGIGTVAIVGLVIGVWGIVHDARAGD